MAEGIYIAIITGLLGVVSTIGVAWFRSNDARTQAKAQQESQSEQTVMEALTKELEALRLSLSETRTKLNEFHQENLRLRTENERLQRTILDHQEIIEDFVEYQLQIDVWDGTTPKPESTWRIRRRIQEMRENRAELRLDHELGD